jgi:hypothetical protein
MAKKYYKPYQLKKLLDIELKERQLIRETEKNYKRWNKNVTSGKTNMLQDLSRSFLTNPYWDAIRYTEGLRKTNQFHQDHQPKYWNEFRKFICSKRIEDHEQIYQQAYSETIARNYNWPVVQKAYYNWLAEKLFD